MLASVSPWLSEVFVLRVRSCLLPMMHVLYSPLGASGLRRMALDGFVCSWVLGARVCLFSF